MIFMESASHHTSRRARGKKTNPCAPLFSVFMKMKFEKGEERKDDIRSFFVLSFPLCFPRGGSISDLFFEFFGTSVPCLWKRSALMFDNLTFPQTEFPRANDGNLQISNFPTLVGRSGKEDAIDSRRAPFFHSKILW